MVSTLLPRLLGCLVWLDLRTGLDDASTKTLRQIPMPATANLTVQGIFMNGGHYGHLSKYPYQLVARTVSDAAIVWSGAPFTAEEKEAVKRGVWRDKSKIVGLRFVS